MVLASIFRMVGLPASGITALLTGNRNQVQYWLCSMALVGVGQFNDQAPRMWGQGEKPYLTIDLPRWVGVEGAPLVNSGKKWEQGP